MHYIILQLYVCEDTFLYMYIQRLFFACVAILHLGHIVCDPGFANIYIYVRSNDIKSNIRSIPLLPQHAHHFTYFCQCFSTFFFCY